MTSHTVKAFDAELRELSGKIAEMGALVEGQVHASLSALSQHDLPVARTVIAADKTINALQREIETRAIQMIARRQPMAADLREIVGCLRIANDLERIGDYAKNIGKRAIATGTQDAPPVLAQELTRIAVLVETSLRRVLEAYAQRDPQQAMAVWLDDKAIDAAQDELIEDTVAAMSADPRLIRLGAQLLFCAKNIERIGDHATNIAESIHYIIKGEPLGDVAKKN